MLLDTIKQRRSIRNFQNQPIERDKIYLCLEAARLAPSACNTQPWRFVIVDDKELKDKLCSEAFSGIYSMCSFAKTASVIVVVISEKQKFLTKVGGAIRGTQFYLIDIGIACEHFILQATELGLGTCWIGWFDENKVKKVLAVPKEKKVISLIAVGYYQDSHPFSEKNRKSLNEIVSFNRY